MWQKAQVHIALLAVNFIYAANYTIAKGVMPAFIEPFGFVFLRVSGALVLFFIVHELFVKQRIDKVDIPRLALCGLFGVATNQLLFLKGLSMTSAINSSLIMITAPILVLIMSAFILKEKMSRWKILGILLGFTGAAMIIAKSGLDSANESWQGDLYIFINAASYAIYLVIVKPLMKKYHPIFVIKWVFSFGFIPVIFVGWNQFASVEWSAITPNYLYALIYVVFCTTFLAYLLNIFALSKANATLVGMYIYLQPILASIIAIIFGNEQLTFLKIGAGVLIFIGVYLVSLPAKVKLAHD